MARVCLWTGTGEEQQERLGCSLQVQDYYNANFLTELTRNITLQKSLEDDEKFS